MKKIIITALLLAAAFAVWGQQVVVAVMPFEVRDRVVTAVDAENFTNYFSNELSGKQIIRLSSRAAIDDAIKREFAQQQSDWSDANKTAEVGRVLNADWIVIGVVSKAGSRIMLNISLFELNTREQLPGVTRLAGSVDDAYDAMTSIVNELAARISGTPAGRPASGGGTPAGRPASGAAPAGGNVEGSLLRAGNTIMKNLAPKSRLAIMYITAPDAEVSEFIAGELESLIVSKGFTLIDHSIMDSFRKETSFQLSGKLDDKQAVSIGKMIGADVIITGMISGSGKNRHLNIRTLDVRTGRIIGMARERF